MYTSVYCGVWDDMNCASDVVLKTKVLGLGIGLGLGLDKKVLFTSLTDTDDMSNVVSYQ